MDKKSFYCGLTELKFASSDTSTMSFEGYGAVFGNIDSHDDVIEPGAFADYLNDVKLGKQDWPAMMLQHGGMQLTVEDMMPVGAYTLIEEDSKGLKLAGDLADTARGIDTYKLMKMQPRPAIKGLSIGYITRKSEPGMREGKRVRLLKRIDVIEISPVTFPANRLALVDSVKNIDDLSTLSEIEDYLREAANLSRSQAKGLIARIKRSSSGEAGSDDLEQIFAALNKRGKALV
jgi:HK97 family phage prohead protease